MSRLRSIGRLAVFRRELPPQPDVVAALAALTPDQRRALAKLDEEDREIAEYDRSALGFVRLARQGHLRPRSP